MLRKLYRNFALEFLCQLLIHPPHFSKRQNLVADVSNTAAHFSAQLFIIWQRVEVNVEKVWDLGVVVLVGTFVTMEQL